MKILIISFFFAPSNVIGAVRVSKMAKYLISQGHDVKVLSGENTGFSETLNFEIPTDKVIRVDWFNINQKVRDLLKIFKQNGDNKNSSFLRLDREDGKRGFLKKLYASIINIPDNHWGWILPAISKGKEIIEEFQPDIIITSGGPFSGFIVANRISKKANIPWVADFRDLWSNNHGQPYFLWRRPIDRLIEKRTLKTASYLTTVSPLLVDMLSKIHRQEVHLVMNGYDEDDYNDMPLIKEKSDILNIVYTGKIYHDGQYIDLLFKACSELPEDKRNNLKITFYGRDHNATICLAEKYNIIDIVEWKGEVTFEQSIQIQRSADILLFLLFHGPQADGVFTGKLFEYIGAERPILAIGEYDEGVVCSLIKDNNFGEVLNTKEAIIRTLSEWVKIKEETNSILEQVSETRSNFSRNGQFNVLNILFNRTIKSD